MRSWERPVNHGCTVRGLSASADTRSVFTLPVDADFRRIHRSDWRKSNVSIVLEINGSEPLVIPGEPDAYRNLTFKVSTWQGIRSDSRSLVEPFEYGVYYPWSVKIVITSRDPELEAFRPLGAETLHGWVIVTRGSDDKIWKYLEGTRIDTDRIPLLGGNISISGSATCN